MPLQHGLTDSDIDVVLMQQLSCGLHDPDAAELAQTKRDRKKLPFTADITKVDIRKECESLCEFKFNKGRPREVPLFECNSLSFSTDLGRLGAWHYRVLLGCVT